MRKGYLYIIWGIFDGLKIIKKHQFLVSAISTVEMEGKSQNHREMEVLTKCCGLLNDVYLCRRTEFQVGAFKIPNIVMNMALSLVFWYSLVTEILLAYDIGLDFKEVSGVILMILGSVQILLIYYSLGYNNGIIVQTVDHIKNIIDRSLWIFRHFPTILHFFFQNKWTLIFTGIRESSKSIEIYETTERDSSKMAEKFRRTRNFYIFLLIGPAALSPIFYVFFGTPTPDRWKLPLPNK